MNPRLLLCLLPLFAGCQVYNPNAAQQEPPAVRLQGHLTHDRNQLLLIPCGEKRHIAIVNDGSSELVREAASLFAEGRQQLFVDLRGQLSSSQTEGVDGEMRPSLVYRLQAEGQQCVEPGFDELLLRASGHEPDWNLSVTEQGLVLQRPAQEPLALPYIEEQLPGGRFNLSSEANGQRLDVWLAPERCTDSMSGNVQHLAAELRLDGQILQGCASFGGARER